MHQLIEQFQKDAKRLHRNANSVEEFIRWVKAHMKRAETLSEEWNRMTPGTREGILLGITQDEEEVNRYSLEVFCGGRNIVGRRILK